MLELCRQKRRKLDRLKLTGQVSAFSLRFYPCLLIFLSQPFILIHGLIRPPGNVNYGGVRFGVVHGSPHGYIRLFPLVFSRGAYFCALFAELGKEFLPVTEIVIFQNDGKFIAANAEDRAVLEGTAD